MSDPKAPETEPQFTVQAFKDDGTRDERAEQLAIPHGFMPAEQVRAESAARSCNYLGLIGSTFKAVPCDAPAPVTTDAPESPPEDISPKAVLA